MPNAQLHHIIPRQALDRIANAYAGRFHVPLSDGLAWAHTIIDAPLNQIPLPEANTLFGNISTAQDYAQYLQNAAVINALIAAEPESVGDVCANDNDAMARVAA